MFIPTFIDFGLRTKRDVEYEVAIADELTLTTAMNFPEYESGGKALYEELAQLVKTVIEGAVAAREDLPHLQAARARAKGLKSLWRKLEERGTAPMRSPTSDAAAAQVSLIN